ncbi:hapless 8 [Raphanus sativus]|uniref:Uncharacterized protein LOC130494759 isoform X2 n=1 Tax=Raphanus sativus TaxID=3726 RepID=A0A9W3CS30_RAPSA|nr:uncharacterized protein LOC130494759 isoform X2 [Raphanus sativus]KAJ4870090.1 hapless 8 [Raphanus sativus]
MFLSTENPPNDPLSSSPSTSSLLHLTTSSSSDELGQTHLQNFSIRDYAYSNRKNKIKNNWPFSPKSLKLCSAHGLTDPLPPFETTASSSSGKQIVSHVHRGSDFAKLGVKGGCSQSRIIIKNGFDRSASVSKSKVETIVVAGTSNNNNKNNKKCGRGGLMVKSKEDTCGGGGGGLVMTTTTCPICKTFSSASNTTLNAHIDQCLSADSELPPVITTKPNKPRVEQCLSVAPPVSSTKPNKPRAKALMKVKTMDDIYATAKGCTLEDLDKRNGTKWASVLSHTNQVVADKSEVSTKKRKASPVGVGPVYIDDKGQKLRILTEFREKKTSSTTTQLREQYNEDGSKESSRSSRKARGGKKQYKYLKLTNLKASSTSEINECQRVFSGEGSSTSHHRRIYNRRMLSKQKKLNEKEHKLYTLWDQPSEEDDDDDDDSWSGGERLVLRGTDSSPLDKQKLRREVSGRNKTMFGSKGAQSHSSRVQMSEKEEKSLAGARLENTVQFKKRLASIEEDKFPPRKNVRELSPRATSMRKSSPPFVTNGWRRLSLPMVELKKARLDSSEEEEEESGKWESEMTQERELSSDDDSPSFSRYDDDDDDDEESSDEEEEDDNNNNNNARANVLDKSNDEEATPSNETIPTSERAMYYYSEQVEEMAYEEEDVRFDSEVRGKGSLFVEVDTIPIPGPPGSFLPSPRDMCIDENLGNSSVITSQFQSFDRNSSESPVSNFASDRLSFSAPSHHETSTIDDKTEPPPRLENNDHESCTCCCYQRKERISEGIALNHQASHLLQRRAEAYSSTAMNLTKSSPTRLDTNHSFEQSPYMIQQELDLQSKFSNRAVVVPPSPNPVLRLMGKDLMVMNQVEEPHKEEASRESLKPTTKFLDPLPWGGTGLYFNTDLYLRNGFESTTHQLPTPKAQQPQDSPFRNSFDHVRRY